MKKYKIAIVGLNFGRWIVESFTKPGSASDHFELAAVCDIDPERARAIAEKSGVEAYTDLDALLQREDISVIGLYTGPAGRANLLRKLLRAGKHVMTTKPFEVDPEAAFDVLQEAKALGRVLHLNSPGPEAAADLAQIQRWEKEFDLGRPVGCRTEVWASYREKSDGSWLDDPERCPVAPVFRLGIYVINDLIRLWGEADRVQVLHTRLFTERPTPDNAQLGIQFRNGALANIYASFCVNDGQYYANSLTMNYENGTIYRNVGQIPFGGGKTLLTLVTRKGEEPAETHTAEYTAGSGLYQWEALHRAIEGASLHEETNPEQIVAGLRVIAAMTRAEKSGQTELV